MGKCLISNSDFSHMKYLFLIGLQKEQKGYLFRRIFALFQTVLKFLATLCSSGRNQQDGQQRSALVQSRSWLCSRNEAKLFGGEQRKSRPRAPQSGFRRRREVRSSYVACSLLWSKPKPSKDLSWPRSVAFRLASDSS